LSGKEDELIRRVLPAPAWRGRPAAPSRDRLSGTAIDEIILFLLLSV
jgi:hypothetical protein